MFYVMVNDANTMQLKSENASRGGGGGEGEGCGRGIMEEE